MPNMNLYIHGMPITICTTIIGALTKMAYKNINTATNAILGRVSGCQHHHINTRHGKQQYNNSKSVFQKPLEFNQWLLDGMNRANEKYGTEFETVKPGLMRIKLKNGQTFLRTLEDFEREHEEYKVNFYL